MMMMMRTVVLGWRWEWWRRRCGGSRWRVEESGCGDRIDPEVGSVFGVGRKNPAGKVFRRWWHGGDGGSGGNFSGGGGGDGRRWLVAAGKV
ncbi:hypothetical protein Tco_0451697 [Tanacetum coccineum]